MADEITVEGR